MPDGHSFLMRDFNIPQCPKCKPMKKESKTMPREQTLELAPEGIIDNIKQRIIRTVIFSQKQRIKETLILIVEQTKDFTVEFIETNWDAIFDKLAVVLKLTAIPGDVTTFGEPLYQCDFDPENAVLVPEANAESVDIIVQFILFVLPYIVKLFK